MKLIRNLRVKYSAFHKLYPLPNLKMMCEVNRRIAVDKKNKFIYFRIPKAANSTVVLNITKYNNFNTKLGSRHLKQKFSKANKLSSKDVYSLSTKYFLFTVARNPFIRIVSSYLDTIVRNKRAKKVKQNLGKDQNSKITFLEFCHYLQSGGLNEDPHWYRQVDFIPCGVNKIHFVGKVESLDTDLKYIQNKALGYQSKIIKTWNPHKTNATSKAYQLYCQESLELVRALYDEDFKNFDYPYDTPWADK